MTNTALCDWADNACNDIPEAVGCYVAWVIEERRYVRGCAYDRTPAHIKDHVDMLIAGKGHA